MASFLIILLNGVGFPGKIFTPLIASEWITGLFVICVAGLIFVWIHSLRQNIKAGRILTYFATSLYGLNTVDDIFWDIAKNCISQLKFEDCVIYQYNPEKNVLVQRAAFGPKNPQKREILNRIEIPFGEGIVGTVAKTMTPEIIHNTALDSRYIVDDQRRYSEITVPIITEGRLFGVIDSEHHQKHFFTRWHLKLLKKIADICAVKLSKHIIEEKLRLKISRDLHDEMGSTLTSINIISKMAMEQSRIDEPLRGQLEKIKNHSSKMMESMSDIVWAINPANDSFEKVLLKVKEFAAEILEPAGINYFFSEKGELDLLTFNTEQRREIHMIFKEAINNTAKYSKATELHISVKLDDGYLIITIADNGEGFQTDRQFSGNGIRNMYARAKELNSILILESIPASGTAICLKIPVT